MNCSYYLYWFIETALFDQIELPKYEKLLAPPSDVIDILSTPLLSRDLPPLKAYYKEVQMWRREQRRLWESLCLWEQNASGNHDLLVAIMRP